MQIKTIVKFCTICIKFEKKKLGRRLNVQGMSLSLLVKSNLTMKLVTQIWFAFL